MPKIGKALIPTISIALLLFIVVDKIALAREESSRATSIVVAYEEFEWWLTRWADNKWECQIFIEHEGLPNSNEVLGS